MPKKKFYKAFENNLTCIGFQYEIGKTYKIEGLPILCNRGFHFCDSVSDVYDYYSMSEDTRVCEVEPLGEIVKDTDGNKYVTNKIRIVREIKNPREASNTNKTCTGYCNSGDRNSGDCNSGDYNSGDRNSGNCNSGDRNSGNRNSGDYNSGDYNSGVFCTNENPKINMFDAPSEWTMQDWLCSDAREILSGLPYTHTTFVWSGDMSEEEKENHPEYKTIGGYLKTTMVTTNNKQAWWDNLTVAEKNVIKALPNFDADKFRKCTGIRV